MNEGSFLPKVSIVIPVYNGANFLREAIDSALGQTYPDIEILVVNDGSDDGGETESIALSYGNQIRYFRKENGGVATALNFGIEHMKGDYFSWLSHDDMYAPEKIEGEIRALQTTDDPTTIIAEGRQIVNEKGEYQRTDNLFSLYDPKRLENPLFVVFHLGINGCGLLIHKSHFKRVGVFNPDLPMTQDYDLWFRILRGQRILYLNSNNVLSRSHKDQGSKALPETYLQECNKLWLNLDSALTDQERMEISGSVYLFYKEWMDCLRSRTRYKTVIAYCRVCMLRALVEEYETNGTPDSIDMFCKETGLSAEAVYEVLLTFRRKEHIRPRVVFYIGDPYSGNDGSTGITLQVADCLRERYDMLILQSNTCQYSEYTLPEGIERLHISPTANDLAGNILLLARISDADILVNNSNCERNALMVYQLAKALGVRTVAWCQESYFYPYRGTELQGCIPNRNVALGQADACVWMDVLSLWTYSRFGNNGVLYQNCHQISDIETTYPLLGKALSCDTSEVITTTWEDVFDAVLNMDEVTRQVYFSKNRQNAFLTNSEAFSRWEIKEFEECICQLQKQIASQKKDLTRQGKEISRLKEEQQNLLTSYSWRLTAPLRRFKKRIDTIKRKSLK